MKPPAHGWTPVRAGRICGAALAGLACCALVSRAAQDPLRWRWSNPQPHGGPVVDMAYSPLLLLGVQVADHGQIYTSDDLDTWLPRDSGTTNALRAVTFLGARLLITGENGCVLYADAPDDFHPGTLLDGPTTDWLEAVAASPTLAVAVGDNGAIYTTSNGITWNRPPTTFTSWLRGVAWGAGIFVTVGTGGFIATSPNGATWTQRASGTTQNLNRVAWANGRFTAVGNRGTVLSSTNGGVNWFADGPPGLTNELEHTCVAGTNRLLVGKNAVWVQERGAWVNQLAKPDGPPNWTYYCCLGYPGYFLIAGQTGLQAEAYQTNGASFSWFLPYDSVRNWLWDVTYASNLYVAVGDYGTVMTSGNGVDWQLETLPSLLTNAPPTFLGVGGTTNLLLAVGEGGTILYTTNGLIELTNQFGVVTQTVNPFGIFWTPVQPRPTTNDLQGVAVLSNYLYVVTGDKGTVLTSTNGTNWVRRTSGLTTTSLLSSVSDFPGGLIACGTGGAIYTSTNGVHWTLRSLPAPTTNWLYRVRWLNGVLLITGQNGALYTSTNGVHWTARSSGVNQWLMDSTFIDGTWFVLGSSGVVLASTDLGKWTNAGSLTSKWLFGAATDSRELVAVGVEGLILRSPVVPASTPVEFLAYARLTSLNGLTNQNIFLFGGQTDQRFTLDRLPSLGSSNWTSGPPLEILSGAGTLYYIETFIGTNQPRQEYYRTTLLP